MKSILVGTLAAILAVGAQSNEAERQLKAAVNAELVNGDLKTAIKQYGEIVAKYKNDRAVAAMALVRMADAYQKMGDSESRKTYERVLREYGDQKEAVARARASLGAAVSPNLGGSTRQLWTKVGGSPYGPVSPDGRYLAFASYEKGSGPTGGIPNIAVHDFVTGADRVLTHSRNLQDHPTRTGRAFSPDSKQIAYPWVIIDNGEEHSEIRISKVNANSSAKPRILFRTEDRLQVNDWSPDGKWIALQILRKDGTRQLGLVSTADGSLRVLKSSGWLGSRNVYFAPDSKHVAFNLTSEEGSDSDIFVLAIDGSHGVPAVTHPANDQVAGWTPDGKHLLFISDRNGLPALWWLPFEGGKAQGNPEILRPNFGSAATYLGPGRSSELYYEVLGGSVRVSVGALDLATGKLAPGTTQQFTANIYPAWSPDGKYLASTTYQLPQGKTFLSVHSLETGHSRELHPQLRYARWPSWAPDGRSLLVKGADLKGRAGIFRVDAQTAEAEPIVTGADGANLVTPQWFPDGKRILYEHVMRNESAIVERDLASGKESEIVRIKSLRGQAASTRSFLLSPDGRFLAYLTSNGTSAHTAIVVKKLVGGESRELLKLNQFAYLGGWTPNGKSLLYSRKDTPDPEAAFAGWILPVEGGEPRRLDLGENFISQLQMHPDGKRIAFWSNNETGEQIWVLENHFPILTTKK